MSHTHIVTCVCVHSNTYVSVPYMGFSWIFVLEWANTIKYRGHVSSGMNINRSNAKAAS